MPAEPRDASACLPEGELASGKETYPRRSRLIAAGEYAAALNSRWRRSATWFSAHVLRSEHSAARLGLTIPKRLVPRAVERNKVKRLVRESFRRRRATLGAIDVVIRLRRLPQPVDWAQARSEVDRLFDWIAARSEGEC